MFRLSIQRVGSVLQNRLSAQVAKNGKFYIISYKFTTSIDKKNNQKLSLQKFRENTSVQYCFGVYNFDFTRKIIKIFVSKNSVKYYGSVYSILF